MVRKQLNIEPTQDETLKALARERGVSESELVREAIDAFVEADARGREHGEQAARIVDALFEEWDRAPFDLGSVRDSYRLGCYGD